ncbi:unnamed protein product [Adineta ricciae]|uniref:Pyridoxal-dependent decarboxylase domain-containing protein 1 n=1 Tax=Adineta ricciae TaxID=249248 RepID=A0A814ILC1_ADIRI|nr:unnamed protein product [Adineta ricciae]CAF1025016.1 unnamed protein product [Adineta ricciae]
MTSEQAEMENKTLSVDNEEQIVELNNRLKTDFMSHCLSYLHEDEEARQCVHLVWNRYLECVGDVAVLAAFFDTLPYHVKTSVLPKYQNEILQWCEKFFHIHSQTILCSTYYSEAFQRVIRYALKTDQYKKAIIYIATDFEPNLKFDLTSSISNIKFEHVQNRNSHDDMIDLQQLEELIKRDANDTLSYPFMVIANAGSPFLGRCDDLKKIKALCEQYDVWVHVIGDLLGSLALLPVLKDNVSIMCDSLTIDIMKLLGIQNLPYLTCFLRPLNNEKQAEDNDSSNKVHPLDEFILHSPSISFLSVWSISQRCSNENLLHHMKLSFELADLLLTRLKQTKHIRILNDECEKEYNTYSRICSDDALDNGLPRSVVVFRFQPDGLFGECENNDDFIGYLDLLTLWLFDKLSQQYSKMNLELLKSIHFQSVKSKNQLPAHVLRFAPLEHLVDNIDQDDMLTFLDDLQRFTDILLATIAARVNLSTSIAKHENLVAIPIPNWAGIGAVRYIPSTINRADMNETSMYEVNRIQSELARQLQSNDSAFSLGGGSDELDSMLYLRLGMIRKREDLEILLQKIAHAGKEIETSLKYIEDMAEKIKEGIVKAQKDLEDENLQLLAQDGLLRQLPLVSNLMSWWSPAPSASPLATKGRSFDLNSGQVESTEDTYVYRMQIKKQTVHAPTHNDATATSTDSSEQQHQN